jgi:protein-disulfide isomerase
MNRNCNPTVNNNDPQHVEACELARLSVALWRVDPAQFPEFHNWLFDGQMAPTVSNAKIHAYELVDKQKLDAELADRVAGQYVAQQVKLYQTIGAGTVPKLLFPGTTITGKVESADSLIQIIRQQNGKE